ncbi:MAG: radical SAM protein [bacterium]|nr:radical SAM protein [bacterium]
MNQVEKSEQSKTFYFQWHFIESCNLRCSHCYQKDYAFVDLEDEKILEIAHTLDYTLKKWNRDGRISLTGGEPFLRKELLLKLLDFFENSPNFYWMGILSNGILVDEEIADRMKPFKKLKEIQVSIDGADAGSHDSIRGEGSFDKAVNAVKLLKRKGFTVSIMFTLHKRNRDEPLRIIDLAHDLGVDYLTIERIVPNNQDDIHIFYMEPGELKETYEAIYQKKLEIEKRSQLKVRVSRPLWCLVGDEAGGFCPAGFTSLSILHDGTILPCRRLELPLGNILEDGLFKPWYTSGTLWRMRNKTLLGGKCKGCEFLGKCGGCLAVAHKITGDFMGGDPQCWKNDDIEEV